MHQDINAAHLQLQSRIGFRHDYRTMGTKELTDILTCQNFDQLDYSFGFQDLAGPEVVASIVRFTRCFASAKSVGTGQG
jgi:hypothetical protein